MHIEACTAIASLAPRRRAFDRRATSRRRFVIEGRSTCAIAQGSCSSNDIARRSKCGRRTAIIDPARVRGFYEILRATCILRAPSTERTCAMASSPIPLLALLTLAACTPVASQDNPPSGAVVGEEPQVLAGPGLDAVDGAPKMLDVGTQVPHGAVRAYVMGERGARNEPVTADDIEMIVWHLHQVPELHVTSCRPRPPTRPRSSAFAKHSALCVQGRLANFSATRTGLTSTPTLRYFLKSCWNGLRSVTVVATVVGVVLGSTPTLPRPGKCPTTGRMVSAPKFSINRAAASVVF